MNNGNNIQGGVRQALTGDKGRAVIATAVGELIRNVRITRRPTTRPDIRPLISGLGGFAAGVGTASVVPATVRGIRTLVRAAPRVGGLTEIPRAATQRTRKAMGSSRDAVDAFTSKLGTTRPGRSTISSARNRGGSAGHRSGPSQPKGPARSTSGRQRATNPSPRTASSRSKGTGSQARRSQTAGGGGRRASSKNGAGSGATTRRASSKNGAGSGATTRRASSKASRG
jgi:hypothetical protein